MASGGGGATSGNVSFTNSTAAKNHYWDDSVQSVSMAFVLNSLIFLGQLTVYGFFLWHPRTSRAFAPLLPESERPLLRDILWGWAFKAWRRRRRLYTENLDATVMVRFCILGVKFSAAGSILACVLIPIYASGEGESDGFNNFHLSNLQRNNEHFWVVVLAAYVLAGLFLHLTAEEWRHFIALRKRHFERLAKGVHGAGAAQAQRSILVESVHRSCRQQDGSGVRRFFEEQLFPEHGVHSCVLHADTRQLHKDPAALLRGASLVTVMQLRQVLGLDPTEEGTSFAAHATGGQQNRNRDDGVADVADVALEERCPSQTDASRSRVSADTTLGADDHAKGAGRSETGCAVCLEPLESVLQASIELGKGVVDRTLQAAELVQDLSIGQAGSSTAFVTMHSVADRIVAEQLILSHSGCWKAKAAPEVRDVIWRNAAVPLNQRRTRMLLGDAGLVLGLVFWSAPVGSLQVWTSLEDPQALQHQWWAQSTFGLLLYTFLREYLPVITLLALQFALPMAFAIIAKEYEGYKVKSEIARRALKWNFKYQFVTLYVTVLCGTVSLSFHDQLGEVAQNPQTLFDILREEVPQVATYFINYVCARVGITVPMLLFFPVLTNSGIIGKAEAEEGKVAPEVRPVHPDFAIEAATLGLVLVLGLTYSVIAPAIMPVCMAFFSLAFLVYCWLFSYVYTPEFDAAGACWYELFNSTILGLLLGTLSLAALASAFKGFNSVEFHALLVLSGGIVAAYMYMHRYYAIPSRFLSLEDACSVDRSCDDAVTSMFCDDYYIDPIIKNAKGTEELPADLDIAAAPDSLVAGEEEEDGGRSDEHSRTGLRKASNRWLCGWWSEGCFMSGWRGLGSGCVGS